MESNLSDLKDMSDFVYLKGDLASSQSMLLPVPLVVVPVMVLNERILPSLFVCVPGGTGVAVFYNSPSLTLSHYNAETGT